MKKLLTLLAAVGITATASASVVACGSTKQKDNVDYKWELTTKKPFKDLESVAEALNNNYQGKLFFTEDNIDIDDLPESGIIYIVGEVGENYGVVEIEINDNGDYAFDSEKADLINIKIEAINLESVLTDTGIVVKTGETINPLHSGEDLKNDIIEELNYVNNLKGEKAITLNDVEIDLESKTLVAKEESNYYTKKAIIININNGKADATKFFTNSSIGDIYVPEALLKEGLSGPQGIALASEGIGVSNEKLALIQDFLAKQTTAMLAAYDFSTPGVLKIKTTDMLNIWSKFFTAESRSKVSFTYKFVPENRKLISEIIGANEFKTDKTELSEIQDEIFSKYSKEFKENNITKEEFKKFTKLQTNNENNKYLVIIPGLKGVYAHDSKALSAGGIEAKFDKEKEAKYITKKDGNEFDQIGIKLTA